MKTQTAIILCILGLIVFVLYGNNSEEGSGIKVPISKYHIVNALDPSGTTKGNDWPWPQKQFFEAQIAFLEKNGGGVLEVYNMSLSIPSSVKLTIKPLVEVPDVYKGEKAVKDAQRKNKRIQLDNQKSSDFFWRKMNKKVLNFTPEKQKDYSYIEKHFKAIVTSLELPQYENYHNLTLLYTDFRNHLPRGKEHMVSIELLEEISSLSEVSVCNHAETSVDISATVLPNYEEFIGVLNATNNY